MTLAKTLADQTKQGADAWEILAPIVNVKFSMGNRGWEILVAHSRWSIVDLPPRFVVTAEVEPNLYWLQQSNHWQPSLPRSLSSHYSDAIEIWPSLSRLKSIFLVAKSLLWRPIVHWSGIDCALIALFSLQCTHSLLATIISNVSDNITWLSDIYEPSKLHLSDVNKHWHCFGRMNVTRCLQSAAPYKSHQSIVQLTEAHNSLLPTLGLCHFSSQNINDKV